MKVWVRIADHGIYESYDDVEEAALGIIEQIPVSIQSPDFAWAYKGFVVGEFKGLDYISLFWGDDDAQYIRSLNDKERLNFINEIKNKE